MGRVRQRLGEVAASDVVRGVRQRLGEVAASDVVRRVARSLNPVVASPSAPLESYAALDALSPSLMPRTSALLGTGMY